MHRARLLFSKQHLNFQLLFFTSFLIFIVPLFPLAWHQVLYNVSFMAVFINAVLVVDYYRKFNIYFAVTAILADMFSILFDLPLLNNASTMLSILLYLYLSAMFIRQIYHSKIVDAKVIVESIIGYLMLAIAFGLLITLVMAFNANAFSFPGTVMNPSEDHSFVSSFIYVSIVTISTLGYGDVLPNTPVARSLATFITVCGQFYMAIIVALLIGKFSATSSAQKENKT